MDSDPIEPAEKGPIGAPSIAGLEQRERIAAVAGQTDAQRAVLSPDCGDIGVGEPDRLHDQRAVEQRGKRQTHGDLGNPGHDALIFAAQLGIGDHEVERTLRTAPVQDEIGERHAVGQAQRREPLFQVGFENAERDRTLGQSPRAEETQQNHGDRADGEDPEPDAGQAAHHRPAPPA